MYGRYDIHICIGMNKHLAKDGQMRTKDFLRAPIPFDDSDNTTGRLFLRGILSLRLLFPQQLPVLPFFCHSLLILALFLRLIRIIVAESR